MPLLPGNAAGMSLHSQAVPTTSLFLQNCLMGCFYLLLHTVPYPVHHCLAHKNIQNESQNESEHTSTVHQAQGDANSESIPPLCHALEPVSDSGAQQSLSLVLERVRAGETLACHPRPRFVRSHLLISSTSLWPCHPSPFPCCTERCGDRCLCQSGAGLACWKRMGI